MIHGEVVTIMLSLRSSPTRAMEALHHEHCCFLVEVKGKPYGSLMFWSTQPATMEKRKRQTKTAADRTFIQGKGRQGQQIVIGQRVPPVADKNNNPR